MGPEGSGFTRREHASRKAIALFYSQNTMSSRELPSDDDVHPAALTTLTSEKDAPGSVESGDAPDAPIVFSRVCLLVWTPCAPARNIGRVGVDLVLQIGRSLTAAAVWAQHIITGILRRSMWQAFLDEEDHLSKPPKTQIATVWLLADATSFESPAPPKNKSFSKPSSLSGSRQQRCSEKVHLSPFAAGQSQGKRILDFRFGQCS